MTRDEYNLMVALKVVAPSTGALLWTLTDEQLATTRPARQDLQAYQLELGRRRALMQIQYMRRTWFMTHGVMLVAGADGKEWPEYQFEEITSFRRPHKQTSVVWLSRRTLRELNAQPIDDPLNMLTPSECPVDPEFEQIMCKLYEGDAPAID